MITKFTVVNNHTGAYVRVFSRQPAPVTDDKSSKAEKALAVEVKAQRARLSDLRRKLRLDQQMLNTTRDPCPPFFAEWLLTLLTPTKHIDPLLGDLRERFDANLRARGRKQAVGLYWANTSNSIGPLLIRYLERWGSSWLSRPPSGGFSRRHNGGVSHRHTLRSGCRSAAVLCNSGRTSTRLTPHLPDPAAV
jgi:hypothetical protein